MHGQLHKITLAFPGLSSGGTFHRSGIPGPEALAGFVTSVNDETALAAYQITNPKLVASRVVFPKVSRHQLRYIGIAPDSAIHSADVALLGRGDDLNRFRVSPGNPIIGCKDVDSALVTIPVPLIGIALPLANQAAHDYVNAPGTTASGWPLRLELGYGEIIPIRSPKRAVYSARFIFSPGVGQSRDMYICTDGRTRVDVEVVTSALTTTLTAFSVVSTKVSGSPQGDTGTLVPLPLDDAGSLSLPVTPSAPLIASFYGNPIPVLNLNIAQATNAAVVQVNVRAYD